MTWKLKCQSIELLLLDVDGVLTDGRLILDDRGVETKCFHVRDGTGIRLWQKAGYRAGLLTHRSSQVVRLRAAELGIEIVRQSTEDKLATTREVAQSLGLELEQVCYVGDDLPDLPAIRAVGFGVAVADAAAEVREAADHVTSAAGGAGAVREVIELILKSQQRWGQAVRDYAGT